jgi:hypothetical protein
MADDKKPAPDTKGAYEGDLAKLRTAFWALLIAAVILTGLTVRFGLNERGELNFPPQGTLVEDTRIANVRDTRVYADPEISVQPIGIQDRRVFGTITRGPKESESGAQMWFVEYDNAPSGWVRASDLTANLGVFVVLNIIPYAFNYVVGVAVVLIVVFGTLLLRVRHAADNTPAVNQREEEEWMRRHNRVAVASEPTAAVLAGQSFKADPRWEHVERMTESVNPGDWRQAIIEADILLEEILTKIGYDGLTIGDKLKNVEPSDMATLDDAWKAHRVRNRIAHDGVAYKVDHALAKETIGKYRKVFEEFNLV